MSGLGRFLVNFISFVSLASCLSARSPEITPGDTLVGYFNGFGVDGYFDVTGSRIGRAISDDNGMHWHRFPDGPLIGYGGILDEMWAHAPQVIHLSSPEADRYLCYYNRWTSYNDNAIAIASSNDGITFSLLNEALIRQDESWRSRGVAFPYILFDSLETDTTKKFKMVYSGWTGVNANYRATVGIGYSADGVSWWFPQPDTIITDLRWADAPLGIYSGFVYRDDERVYHLFVEAGRSPYIFSDTTLQGGEQIAGLWHLISFDFEHWTSYVHRPVLQPDFLTGKLLGSLEAGDSTAVVRTKRRFVPNTVLRWIESADPTYGLRSYSRVKNVILLNDSTQALSFNPPVPFFVDTAELVKSVTADRLYPSDYRLRGDTLEAYVVGFDNDHLFETMVLATWPTKRTTGNLIIDRQIYPVLPMGVNRTTLLSDYWTGMSAENLRIMRSYSIVSSNHIVSRSGPSEFQLEPAFPNPFNPTATVRYTLPEESSVTIKLYNLLGQELETLLSGRQSIGMHSITVDGQSLASGIYILVAQFNEHVLVQKLCVLR